MVLSELSSRVTHGTRGGEDEIKTTSSARRQGSGGFRALGLPLRHFVGLVHGSVEVDEAFERIFETHFSSSGDRVFTLFHPFVTSQQQSLRFRIILLAQHRTPAKQGFGVKRPPVFGFLFS